MLCRAGLDLEGLQLLLGLEPPEGTLDDNGCVPLLLEMSTCHPAPGILLDDGGFMFLEELVRTSTHRLQVYSVGWGQVQLLQPPRGESGLPLGLGDRTHVVHNT